MARETEPFTAAAILLAGGLGRRYGEIRPKVFAELDHKPLFVHAADHLAASKRFRELVLVVHSSWVPLAYDLAQWWHLEIARHILPAAEDPVASVEQALKEVHRAYDVVAVHEAAFPLPDPAMIAEVLEAAYEEGTAASAVPLPEGEAAERGEVAVRLAGKRYIVHSPLAFRRDRLTALLEAYPGKREIGKGGTDSGGGGVGGRSEAEVEVGALLSLAEHLGEPVRLLPVTRENPHVMIPEDLEHCLNVLRGRKQR